MIAPLVLVAIVAAVLGFVVQRGLTTPRAERRVDVSVIALPSTPKPSPKPTPEPESTPRGSIRVNGRSSGGSSDSGVSNCPAGCTCESRPPAGVVILCR
jgi:hypothetical protein